MAEIDVTELLEDPDFTDPLILIHRAASVNNYGENVLVETEVETYGSVQPASGKTVQRLPEALRNENIFSFWLKGEIKSDGTAVYPDLIYFNGKRYQVKNVFDWTNWGEGFSEGVCVAEKLS